jgi:alpha-ketoglutaric semialdehyde dehydrogenase
MSTAKKIGNWINGKTIFPKNVDYIPSVNPHTGLAECYFASSLKEDVETAIETASGSFSKWSQKTPVARGELIDTWARIMEAHREKLAQIVARETGKTLTVADAEVGSAIAEAKYFAGEGMRFFANSLTSGMPGKYSHVIRQPIGVAGLIVPANTPIANIAWKIFPALVCGNTVVLKASEDSPELGFVMAELSKEAGIPDGVFNVVQGIGDPAGRTIVEDERVGVISFTGSTNVGRWIAKVGGKRLARVSLELGGKNPFIVCDDADIDQAVHWASLSAFSNAGQRCASGSRIIIFERVYDEFISKLTEKANSLSLGIDDGKDLGPVMNEKQCNNILNSIEKAKNEGGKVLCGGKKADENELSKGFYICPTLIEGLGHEAALCKQEIFGPVATVQEVSNIKEALKLANNTEYGLTAAVHTTNVDRAMWLAQRIRAGMVNINIGTFGSEVHMPFGGFGASGNGTREPGVEALEVYTELKNISFLVRESGI